jgi:hypothetical protein
LSNNTTVVYNKTTKEILAVIVNDGECICRNDVEFAVYENTEPMFTEKDGVMVLDQNKFMLHT